MSAACVWFVGLQPGVPTAVDPATLVNVLGIGAASTDTNVQVYHNDASGSAVKIDLGSLFPAFATGATYQAEFVVPPGSASVAWTVTRLDVPQVASGSFNTEMPNPTTTLRRAVWNYNTAASNLFGAGMEFEVSVPFVPSPELFFAVGDSEFAATQVLVSFAAQRPVYNGGQPVVVSNMAVSGSHASEWLAGSANYTAAVAAFAAARIANSKATPKALLIYLGTNDATAASDTSATWTANMQALIANVRADLGLPRLRVYFAKLPVGVGAGKDATLWASVRAQMAALSGSFRTDAVQMPEGTYSDGLHFDAAGSLVAGTSIAAAVA